MFTSGVIYFVCDCTTRNLPGKYLTPLNQAGQKLFFTARPDSEHFPSEPENQDFYDEEQSSVSLVQLLLNKG